jgi:hypothetical protein
LEFCGGFWQFLTEQWPAGGQLCWGVGGENVDLGILALNQFNLEKISNYNAIHRNRKNRSLKLLILKMKNFLKH